jgi:hypothetical protein
MQRRVQSPSRIVKTGLEVRRTFSQYVGAACARSRREAKRGEEAAKSGTEE